MRSDRVAQGRRATKEKIIERQIERIDDLHSGSDFWPLPPPFPFRQSGNRSAIGADELRLRQAVSMADVPDPLSDKDGGPRQFGRHFSQPFQSCATFRESLCPKRHVRRCYPDGVGQSSIRAVRAPNATRPNVGCWHEADVPCCTDLRLVLAQKPTSAPRR